MKEFVKMTLATLTGLLLFGFLSMFIMIGMIGACRCRKWKPLSSLTIKTIGTIVRDSGKDGKNMKQ